METQAYIEEVNTVRFLVLTSKDTRMRIATKETIQGMSEGSLKSYKDKIASWRDEVHAHGTPEAIRTIDYLRNTTLRAYDDKYPRDSLGG